MLEKYIKIFKHWMIEMGKNATSALQFKLPIFGDAGVGKTTLTHRYLHGLFKQSYHGMISVIHFSRNDRNRLLLETI